MKRRNRSSFDRTDARAQLLSAFRLGLLRSVESITSTGFASFSYYSTCTSTLPAMLYNPRSNFLLLFFLKYPLIVYDPRPTSGGFDRGRSYGIVVVQGCRHGKSVLGRVCLSYVVVVAEVVVDVIVS